MRLFDSPLPVAYFTNLLDRCCNETNQNTLLEQVLPLVLTSGFLRQHDDCHKVAGVCCKWHQTWKDVRDHLPFCVRCDLYCRPSDAPPPWILSLPFHVQSSKFAARLLNDIETRVLRQNDETENKTRRPNQISYAMVDCFKNDEWENGYITVTYGSYRDLTMLEFEPYLPFSTSVYHVLLRVVDDQLEWCRLFVDQVPIDMDEPLLLSWG